MEYSATDSLLDLADQLRRKAKESDQAGESIFKKRAAKRSEDMAGLAASAFSEGDFQKALDWLTRAINNLPSAPLYTKRSVVHLALHHYVLAAADAICAIGTDPNYASGYLCGALSRIRLGEYDDALKYLETLRQCFPNSKQINMIYVSCRNSFWETVSIAKDLVHEEFSALEESKLNALKVELSSSGVLEASKLTEDFVRRVIETYKRGLFHLPQKYVTMILKNVLDILAEHPNIVSIDISSKQTLTVVGDLRGKFNNLLSIFRQNRSPHFGRPYLFNGNLIGNDKMSLPVLIIVLCLKILFPEDVFINRGSDECLEMCEATGFETEVLTVYDEEMMKGFTEVFNWLPVAHILNNNVLIVHGGLFEDEKVTLADVQNMKRCYQPPDNGPMCDILHSDPWNYKGISKTGRRRGIWFGPDVTERFCLHNCVDYVVRSHQNVGDFGYEVQTYRQCLTVDSSTNYATYLVIRGRTSSYKLVHARKDRNLPKHCKCFLVCNCGSPEDAKQGDPLHDGYVTTNLALPAGPAVLKDSAEQSQTNLSKHSSSKSVQSLQSSYATPSKISSKPILVNSKSRERVTPGSSALKVSFSTSNKSVPLLTKTESRVLGRQSPAQDESIVIVSGNHPAPSSSTISRQPSSPTSITASTASVSAKLRALSKSHSTTNLTRMTSFADLSSFGGNSLKDTNSKTYLGGMTQQTANDASNTLETSQAKLDDSDDVTRTLFISSVHTNMSTPLAVRVHNSPDNSRVVLVDSRPNAAVAANAEITVQTLDNAAFVQLE